MEDSTLKSKIDEGDLIESLNTSQDAIRGDEGLDFSDVVRMVCGDFSVEVPEKDIKDEHELRSYIRNHPDARYRNDD